MEKIPNAEQRNSKNYVGKLKRKRLNEKCEKKRATKINQENKRIKRTKDESNNGLYRIKGRIIDNIKRRKNTPKVKRII